MLSVVGNIVSFMAAYTAIDAVVPDLDSFEAIPDNMKWTYAAESSVTREVLGILDQNAWKSMEKNAKQNLTIDWIYSKAYKRDIVKFTTYFNRSLGEVVDSIWLDQQIPNTGWGWDILVSKSACLSYAGRNKIILAQESKAAIPGWFVAPREFITLHFLLENNDHIRQVLLRNESVNGDKSSSFASDNKESQSSGNSLQGPDSVKGVLSEQVDHLLQHPTAMVLITNVSKTEFDIPAPSDVVRVSVGSAGIILTEVESPNASSTPPSTGLTKVEWLINSDGQPPAFMPTTVIRRVLANTIKAAIVEWKSYLEAKFPGPTLKR